MKRKKDPNQVSSVMDHNHPENQSMHMVGS